MSTEPNTTDKSRWAARFVRLGHRRMVMIVTAASVLLSVGLTACGMSLTDPDAETFAIAMVLAIAVPSIVAPIVTHAIMHLVMTLEATRAELLQVAIRDPLTQVYNRRYFMEQLQLEAARYFRTGERMSLLMIDADKFKAVNDRYGHATGDRVLQMIARACTAALREYDILARYGGEEFVVLLPATELGVACDVAERIRATVAGVKFDVGEADPLTVTVSIGVSSLAPADPECRVLFDAADSALYDAKRRGRNQCVCTDVAPPPADESADVHAHA